MSIRTKGIMTTSNFENKLEGFLQYVIKDNFLTKWDENAITHDIAKIFATKFKDVEIVNSYPIPSKIRSLAYRNNGGINSNEYEFGDLGFLVKIQYPDGTFLEGVSFLEAKRTYPKNGENSKNLFEQINIEQIERIYENAPYSYLLLYDHNPIKNTIPLVYSFNSHRSYESRSVVVPMNIAKKLNI